MYKLFSFLMLGLSLIAFQVVEVEAQRGDSRGGDVRDSRGGDTRDPRGGGDVRRDPRSGGDTRDPRGAASSVDNRGGGLSKKERVEACKKQYGKKKKNKKAKQACIAAAKKQ